MRRLYRLAEVLEMLGTSRTQIYREMNEGRIAYIQRGPHRLFEPEAIDAYIASLKVTDGVGRLLELVDDEGRIDVACIPEATTLADIAAAKRAIADRQAVA